MLCTLTTPEKRASKGHDEEDEEGEVGEGLLSKLIFAAFNLIRISQNKVDRQWFHFELVDLKAPKTSSLYLYHQHYLVSHSTSWRGKQTKIHCEHLGVGVRAHRAGSLWSSKKAEDWFPLWRQTDPATAPHCHFNFSTIIILNPTIFELPVSQGSDRKYIWWKSNPVRNVNSLQMILSFNVARFFEAKKGNIWKHWRRKMMECL